MRFVFFCHSLLSDWNHGNAHFLRGIVSELVERGHRVTVLEPFDAWSVQNLVHDHGEASLALALEHYPAVEPRRYDRANLDLDEALDGADVVVVHEWSTPDLVARIGAHRKRTRSRYTLLFHDTHHRSVTAPEEMDAYDLSGYDGVLAFGEAVRDVHEREGWGRRAWVWHEGADVRVFKPNPLMPASDLEVGPESKPIPMRGDVVWIGNWGDDERTCELRELFLEPARDLRLLAKVFGVRYPDVALEELAACGVSYGGWLPNFHVPRIFAAYKMTVHVPRRPYVEQLPGVPTIRVFEALACGIPLVSGYWRDTDGLFRSGVDYLVAKNGSEMRAHMRTLLSDPDACHELAARGRESILARHTCAHRVDELFAILDSIGDRAPGSRPNVPLGVFL
ncbi:MAG TPA: glycosyltransferase [Labilithrix sp.]|nr:glycosyltransferase [Labilithrix sp.]